MITINREEKRNVIVWSFVAGFFVAMCFSFILYLAIPSFWGWGKKDFFIIAIVLFLAISIILSFLISLGLKFSSSIRINRE